MFQWAVKEKYLSENPAADLAEDVYRSTGAKKTAARDQREPFTPEELERVFSAAWFSTGTGERTRDGSFFTIGHIATAAGPFHSRINELSQLYLADISQTPAGTVYLDFNLVGPGKVDSDESDDSDLLPDKSLKTTNSVRQVPLHSRLLDLGLLVE